MRDSGIKALRTDIPSRDDIHHAADRRLLEAFSELDVCERDDVNRLHKVAAGLLEDRDPVAVVATLLGEGVWEERVEERYGFWRRFVDGVVQRYLDGGRHEAGLARVRCPECAAEFFVACSCKGRGFCPSCCPGTYTYVR